MAAANSVAAPGLPPDLVPPKAVDPVDSVGAPLPVDPAGDVAAGLVAVRIAHLRHGAQQVAIDAAAHRARSHALRAGLAEAHGRIGEAEGSIGTVKGYVAHRRTVTEQAGQALESSQEKAAKVAGEAPGFADQADAGQARTGPMVSESGRLAADAGSQSPDDEEAAAKSRQQGGQIQQVNSSLTSIDSAAAQTGEKARSLQADAARATAQNTASQASITAAGAGLDSTDAKLGELTTQNDAARSAVEGLAGSPAELDEGAAAQQARADAVLARSVQLEARMHAVQEGYQARLSGLPGPPPHRRRPGTALPADGGVPVQREATAAAPPPRERFAELDEFARTISNDQESAEDRARAAREAQAQQQADLRAINDECGGDFSTLDAADKARIGLQLTFSRSFGSLAATNWPRFGLSILRGFVDPRVSMAGIVSGLGMILSGGANLFSAQQWAADPLGNLLKSAADIATGVTVVLGSIAGLAVAVIAISAAIILLSWGTLAPVFLPVISFCSAVASTVGPWAVEAAAIALELNAYVLIKNLVDAATAPTADALERESVAMSQDVNTMGMMAMQIAGDHLGKAVGPAIGESLGGATKGLANSGTAAGAMLSENLTRIGGAMTEGGAMADAWAGRDAPVAAPAGGGGVADAGWRPPVPAARAWIRPRRRTQRRRHQQPRRLPRSTRHRPPPRWTRPRGPRRGHGTERPHEYARTARPGRFRRDRHPHRPADRSSPPAAAPRPKHRPRPAQPRAPGLPGRPSGKRQRRVHPGGQRAGACRDGHRRRRTCRGEAALHRHRGRRGRSERTAGHGRRRRPDRRRHRGRNRQRDGRRIGRRDKQRNGRRYE
ncbi:hypothetical protein [Actinacidiphila bryophytorum]|uniref:hypothetical protein n=1 Tax=Actinacidiphila bryophytorum TaxID=1436133 RepID=UPI002176C940|nr:hypothetical protein [Actinacidiphila bryophytorum]UWE11222.1 hypothetical protein NYE86_22550 [Actinacidiphila bryophytorum]